jgi:schlafen family protein
VTQAPQHPARLRSGPLQGVGEILIDGSASEGADDDVVGETCDEPVDAGDHVRVGLNTVDDRVALPQRARHQVVEPVAELFQAQLGPRRILTRGGHLLHLAARQPSIALERAKCRIDPVSSLDEPVKVHPGLVGCCNIQLPWPSFVHAPGFVNAGHLNAPQGYLVGEGATPSFPAFGGAFNAFFYDQYAISGIGNPQLNTANIQVVDNRARIRRVRVRPTSIDLWLGGSALPSTVVELNGAEYRTVVRTDTSRVLIPLPDGLPSDAWIWLKSSAEWLDFRPLNNWGGETSPDVEMELPRDPAAELSHLATRGEGPFLEYKEKLPDTKDQKRTVFKTVVAFANGGGGSLVFGIEDETKLIKGLSGKRAVERRRLTDLVRDLVSPAPRVSIEAGDIDGRHLLVLHVPPGGGTIYALTIDGNKPEYYVRRDGTTFYARPDELEAIAARPGGPGAASALPWIRSRL